MGARVARLGEPADDELRAKLELELEPVVGTRARLISRVGALCDDAFPAGAPCSREHRGAAHARFAESQRRIVQRRRRTSIRGAARRSLHGRPVSVVRPSRSRSNTTSVAGASTERREISSAFLRCMRAWSGWNCSPSARSRSRPAAARDDLAVEHDTVADPGDERPQRRDHLGKLRLLLLAVARHQAHVARRDVGDHAHAVVLGLVRPPATARERVTKGGVHRLRERRDALWTRSPKRARRVPGRSRPVRGVVGRVWW